MDNNLNMMELMEVTHSKTGDRVRDSRNKLQGLLTYTTSSNYPLLSSPGTEIQV